MIRLSIFATAALLLGVASAEVASLALRAGTSAFVVVSVLAAVNIGGVFALTRLIYPAE